MASDKDDILSNDPYCYHKKSASSEAPFRLFLTFVTFLAIFTLSTLAENNLAQNLGHNLNKKCTIVSFGSFFSEKQSYTFGHILHVKILLGHLNLWCNDNDVGDHSEIKQIHSGKLCPLPPNRQMQSYSQSSQAVRSARKELCHTLV